MTLTMFMVATAAKSEIREFDEFSEKYGEGTEEVDSQMIYRFSATYAKQARRKVQRATRALRGCELVPRSFVVSLASAFDAFLGQLLASLYRSKPELLTNSDRTLTLPQLTALGTIAAASDYVITKEVETVIRKSRPEQFGWLEKRF